MNGMIRTFYAAAATFAMWNAKRRKDSASRWLDRAGRWSAMAKGGRA